MSSIKQHKTNQKTYHQTTLPFNRTTTGNQINGVWGHYPTQIDMGSTLRILFNNPRGIKVGANSFSTIHSLTTIESLGVGVLSLAETSINWGKSSLKNRVYNMFHKVWKNFSMNHSHIDESFSEDNQPGGTVTVVLNDWKSRIQEKGSDLFGLGRWSYQVLRGKGSIKVMIIPAYRVSQQYMSSVGPKTAAMQQFRSLSKQYCKAEIQFDPKRRFQFINDLKAWVEELIRKSYEIILCMDANEGVDEQPGKYCPLELTLDKPIKGKGHDGSLNTLIRT